MLGHLMQRWRQRNDDWHRQDTLKRIERFGWTAIYVGDYQSAPTWAYSIGFHSSLGAPEVVIFDIPMQSANAVFHEIYGDLASGKLVIGDGEPWRAGEFENPLVWRKVHPTRLDGNDPENPWLGLAEHFSAILAPEKGPMTAFQLVISDPDGHLPWETGYDERLRFRQRALWEPLASAS